MMPWRNPSDWLLCNSNGVIISRTYLTTVLKRPIGNLSDPRLVADPTPTGLTAILKSIGIDIELHITRPHRMITIRNTIDF